MTNYSDVVNEIICFQAIKTLEDYHLKDEKEQDEQQKVLLHLYQNMGLCHLQKAECGSAIRYANNALSIDPGSPKAHYIKAKVCSPGGMGTLLVFIHLVYLERGLGEYILMTGSMHIKGK